MADFAVGSLLVGGRCMVMVCGALVSLTSLTTLAESVLPADGLDEGFLSGRMVVVTKRRPGFGSAGEGASRDSVVKSR